MTTIRACTGLAAAILAVSFAAGTALAEPAKPAADSKADPKAEKKTDKAAPTPAPDKTDKGDKADKSDKKELVSDAEAKRFADFFDKLVAIVVATQDDCAKMATGVNGHIDANQALVNEMSDPKNQNKELPPAVKERIQKKARDEMAPAITKKCATDKSVGAAFNRLGGGRAK